MKHPAARLDNGTGFDPVSSHPIGYGTWLSVLFRPFLREQGEGHAGLPARVRLPSVGAVGRLFLFERFASRYPCWLALAGIPPLTGVSLSSPAYAGFPFGTVGSMTTCSVLRCPQTPLGTFAPRQGFEMAVCAKHNSELENGARWHLTAGQAAPGEDGKPDMLVTLLMDDDLPPELTGWDGDWSITDQPGMNVRLVLGQQEVTFWASELAAKRLSSFLAAPAS